MKCRKRIRRILVLLVITFVPQHLMMKQSHPGPLSKCLQLSLFNHKNCNISIFVFLRKLWMTGLPLTFRSSSDLSYFYHSIQLRFRDIVLCSRPRYQFINHNYVFGCSHFWTCVYTRIISKELLIRICQRIRQWDFDFFLISIHLSQLSHQESL